MPYGAYDASRPVSGIKLSETFFWGGYIIGLRYEWLVVC